MLLCIIVLTKIGEVWVLINIIVFAVLALIIAALLCVLCSIKAWVGVFIFLGAFILLQVLYLMFFYAASFAVDQSRPLEKQNRLCRIAVANIIGMMCAYSGLRPHFTGLELLPKDRRFVLVCNHRSMYDPLIVMDKLREYNIAFISKPSNLKLPIAGRIAYGAGFLAIDRENDRKALTTILTAADYLKRDICSMGIYPEGSRTKTGEMLPFHAGSFKIAQRANVPLVIAAIHGSENIKKNLLRRRTDVYMDFLELLPPEKVKSMSTAELSEYSRGIIQARLNECPTYGESEKHG